MNFRSPSPKRPRNGRASSGRHRRKAQSSFLKSLVKIGIPAGLLGAASALFLNMDLAEGSLSSSVRQWITNQSSMIIAAADDQASPSASSDSKYGPDLVCANPRVTDGDTLRCGKTRIRLEGIDTPEMPGHCREGRDCTPGDPLAAKANLERLVSRGEMACYQQDVDHYGRMIARCTVADVDLSCEQVRSGHAVYRYSPIIC